jgi:hypothetical protein
MDPAVDICAGGLGDQSVKGVRPGVYHCIGCRIEIAMIVAWLCEMGFHLLMLKLHMGLGVGLGGVQIFFVSMGERVWL